MLVWLEAVKVFFINVEFKTHKRSGKIVKIFPPNDKIVLLIFS